VLENNGMITILQTDSLVISEITTLVCNPAAIFLASQALPNRKEYQADQNTIARLLGADVAFSCNWAAYDTSTPRQFGPCY
jgi:hypothetical protein